ncbi:MAG: CopD family protein [Pseudolabrys sp.]|nr:CopD family protein [Pseudolabrys sp.]
MRGVHFAATLWAAGTVCFLVLVADPPALRRRLTGMAWAALILTVLSGAVWLAVIAASILDVPVAGIFENGGLWTVLADTRFGQVASLRLGLAAALGLLLALDRYRGLQLATAAALAGLIALVGHAGATAGPVGWLHMASDIVHVLAAAAWLGGLPALAMVLTGPPDDAARATARFSVLGIIAVAALLGSGVVNSWQLLSGPDDLLTNSYGRVLSIKMALFAAMVAVAAVNRFFLTSRLPATARTLRRNTLIETGFGLSAVMLAGLLGTMIPGGHVHTNAAAPQSEAAYVHIHTDAVMADVTIDPGQSRKNTATIRLLREDFSEYPASDVKFSIEPRDGGVPPLELAATQAPDGTWRVENLNISRAGVWILRLTIGATSGAPVTVDAPIVITQCSNECS